MSDTNKQLIRRWLAFAGRGFRGSFDEFIAPQYIGHLGEARMDLAELERLERAFAAAFPDATYSIDDLLAESDRVVARVTTRGTHHGEFQGIRPTRRPIEFTGIVIYRIADGKIVESWGEMDLMRFIRQLRADETRSRR